MKQEVEEESGSYDPSAVAPNLSASAENGKQCSLFSYFLKSD